eukprot:12705743-Heterocapsa_arctica.AAC.1
MELYLASRRSVPDPTLQAGVMVSLLLAVSVTVCHCPMRDQSRDDHAYITTLLFASVLSHVA